MEDLDISSFQRLFSWPKDLYQILVRIPLSIETNLIYQSFGCKPSESCYMQTNEVIKLKQKLFRVNTCCGNITKTVLAVRPVCRLGSCGKKSLRQNQRSEPNDSP